MQRWKLRLHGDFRMDGPDGLPRNLGTKARGMVAALWLNRETGLSRAELGQILWEDYPAENQRNSVKQALASLRKSLGEGVIASTPEHIRFTDSFVPLCDSDCEGQTNKSFMPDCKGAWFDEQRMEPYRESASHLDDFAGFLKWVAANNPDKTIPYLVDNFSLSNGLDPATVRTILDSCHPKVEPAGWREYFHGVATSCLDRPKVAHRRFKDIYSVATEAGDDLLRMQSIVQICLAAASAGHLADALRLSEFGMTLAESTKQKSLQATALQLRGNMAMQAGSVQEGSEYYKRAVGLYASEVDYHFINSILAYYLALHGRHKEANTILEGIEKSGAYAGHAIMKMFCLGGKAVVLDAHDSNISADWHETAINAAAEIGNRPLEIQFLDNYAQSKAAKSESAANARRRASSLRTQTGVQSRLLWSR